MLTAAPEQKRAWRDISFAKKEARAEELNPKDRTHGGFTAETVSASVIATESALFPSTVLTEGTLHHLHLLSLPGISKGGKHAAWT